jgi:transcriptional regulator with XRE-family HTH domain
VGLPSYGERRVPSLRREEVAALAGVGIDYYRRLERGHVSGVSKSVLEALARALQLDDAERAHLSDLARTANPVAAPRRRRPVQQRVRPVIQSILDAIGTPALLRNERADYLAANRLGRALYAPMFESPEQPANSARFTFLDPAAMTFYPDWDHVADELVAHLRSEGGRNPHDRGLSDLVGQLSTRSDQFRTRWAQHNVRFHRTGTKRLHHPVVGKLTLSYETMELSADPGLRSAVYTAEAGVRLAGRPQHPRELERDARRGGRRHGRRRIGHQLTAGRTRPRDRRQRHPDRRQRRHLAHQKTSASSDRPGA